MWLLLRHWLSRDRLRDRIVDSGGSGALMKDIWLEIECMNILTQSWYSHYHLHDEISVGDHVLAMEFVVYVFSFCSVFASSHRGCVLISSILPHHVLATTSVWQDLHDSTIDRSVSRTRSWGRFSFACSVS